MKDIVYNKSDWYLSHFEDFEKSLNGESASPIHKIRRKAISQFSAMGFPTTRHEEWRFTDVAPIAKANFRPVVEYSSDVTKKDIGRFLFKDYRCRLLVFVNGHFSTELSSIGALPKGAFLGSLAAVLTSDGELLADQLGRYAQSEHNPFTALNTAFMQDGAFIRIPDGASLDEPIHLLFVAGPASDGCAHQPRNLIIVGKDAKVSIVESFGSVKSHTYFTNTVTELRVGENAIVEHDKLQDESVHAFHVSAFHVHQQARSNFTSNSISLGGSLVRNDVTVVLDAEGIESTLNGLSLATGQQLVDNHTTIDHAKPNCASHELYKAIIDGRARGVFSGKIVVRKDAQKTDAKQTNKTLLLSDEATIDTKPQLEIFADDVKCTHGATVGQLDEEQLFYLRSRGLGETESRDILTFAFASDVIGRIHVEPLRVQLDAMLRTQLQRGRIVQ
jgi:Fe-S cluster assembly protein SufD